MFITKNDYSTTDDDIPIERHSHEWVVISTTLAEGWLMLQCVEYGLDGTVEDPSTEEWETAFHSPSRPYRWYDEARVQPQKGTGHCYVMKKSIDHRCECYDEFGVLEPHEYERVPAEVLIPAASFTDAERTDLLVLADLVAKENLCSNLFAFFIRSYQQDTGYEATNAVQEIAHRIESIDQRGLHCSPSVVARVLRDCAAPKVDVN